MGQPRRRRSGPDPDARPPLLVAAQPATVGNRLPEEREALGNYLQTGIWVPRGHPNTRLEIISWWVPTWIVHWEADLRLVWTADHLASLIPSARLQTMPNVGHFPWLEQPERFARILRQFLPTL
ncbi:MAG TPA: alpha/beta hydrolase [Chloroflexota bacterium]|nr:alpha/beta hydrolase [Chloroflexota bacterium]